MAACSYGVTVHSTAPPERLFELLADATSWPLWAGFLTTHGSWEREGSPRPGGVGAIRKLGRWPMYGREEIVAYGPPTHLAYTIVSGQPVRNYRADVTLTLDRDDTLISWTGTFDPLIPGTGMLLTALFRRIITRFASGLADLRGHDIGDPNTHRQVMSRVHEATFPSVCHDVKLQGAISASTHTDEPTHGTRRPIPLGDGQSGSDPPGWPARRAVPSQHMHA